MIRLLARHRKGAHPAALWLVGFLLCSAPAWAQTVTLSYTEEPLNEILLDLNLRHQVQVSIDAQVSASCVLTLEAEYPTVDAALQALAEACGLEVVQIAGVYTFRYQLAPAAVVAGPAGEQRYLYQGQVVARAGGEPLPFTVIRLTEQAVVADAFGRFSLHSPHARETVRGEHLGYRIQDTTLLPGAELRLQLMAAPLSLAEVEISDAPLVSVARVGDRAGHMKLNDVSNSHLPGNTNNLIFNNLRMYPGIAAAGESVADYVIWGSYPGQNYITFDGITLFSSWGVNQEFGRVNPAMVKNVEVYKGGYQVPYGDRIGGVVLMEGREGHRQQQEADIQLTNQMASGYINVPLFGQKASLQLAARSTFAQAWQPLTEVQNTRAGDVFTRNTYRDLNLKLSADLSPRDALTVSFLGSGDYYEATFNRRRSRDGNNSVQVVTSTQIGSSLRYTRTWAAGGLTQVLASQSRYVPTRTLNAYFLAGEGQADRFQTQWSNTISEQRVSLNHTLPSRGGHQLSAELGFIVQASQVTTETPNRVRERPDQFVGRVSGYLLDAIQITPSWSLDLGLKADAVPRRDTVYLQPRLSTSYSLGDAWRFNAAWGYYTQFLALTPYTDVVGNQTEVWRVADGAPIQPLFAEHRVVGASWYGATLQVTVEAFQKRFSSLGQFVERGSERPEFAQGRGQARGVDFYARWQTERHALWGSYTVSEVTEQFRNQAPEFADHYQPHEVKGAYELSLPSSAFSITNVFGSPTADEDTPYWRTDVSATYFLPIQQADAELGVSILNLLNRRNPRLGQTYLLPEGDTYATLGIPFTASVYARVRLSRRPEL